MCFFREDKSERNKIEGDKENCRNLYGFNFQKILHYLFALLDHVIDHVDAVMVFYIMELMNNYDVSLSSLIIRYGVLLISSSL